MLSDYRLAIGLVLLPIALWLCTVVAKAFQKGLSQIPGPLLARFSPLWRMRFVFDGQAHESYRELHRKYGTIVRTAPNVVDISDPSVIPTIYGISSKFQKSEFYHAFESVHDGAPVSSMFSVRDPEEHKHLKRSVSQKFSMTAVCSLEYLVDPCSKLFTDAMLDLQGQTVDLGAWVQWYAFDVIGAITFSHRFGFLEERRDVNGVISGIEKGLVYCGMAGQMPWIHDYLVGNPKVQKFIDYMTAGEGNPIPAVIRMIEDSIKSYDGVAAEKTNRGDFLSFLEQQRAKSDTKITNNEMLNHLSNNLLAGSDTTAISLRAVFYYLIKNPAAYKKLQQEIDNAADKLSPMITYAECLELSYLQLVMKEAMRMHPGVSFPLERVVPAGGATLSNTYVPAGTIVGVNAAVIHRDTSIFGEDADEFRPERWISQGKEDEERIKIMERHLLTFGAGVRTCIGKHISIMEMGKLVPQVLRMFDVEWASPEPEWKIGTYWFAKQSGLLVKFKPRAAHKA